MHLTTAVGLDNYYNRYMGTMLRQFLPLQMRTNEGMDLTTDCFPFKHLLLIALQYHTLISWSA